MCPNRIRTEQEIHGRHGRPITDQDAHEINRVEELSYDLKIHEVMSKNLQTASPDISLSDVLKILRINRISGVPVVQDEKLVGVISIEDIVRALQNNDLTETVGQYMTRELVTVASFDSIVKAMQTFAEKHVGRLPVVDEEKKLVGMITKGDITRGILVALQKDYKAEEVRRYRASHLFEDIISDRTTLVLRYNIKAQDFTHGGNASSHIKRALLRLGADAQIARRCGIAVYEAEMNLIIHTTHGGILKLEVEPHRITMSTTDDGPGIPDVEQVLQPGYSTATDQVREMGFGAGMGLVNIKRCVDNMELESTVGKGTKLIMRIHVPAENFNARKEG
ncbi:MAG TPA: CBS domain-containing protein [Anaerolineales bacterium]|nr:CBS domain-containing protein [Anaerolineales bacterium]HMV96061.1 CBS domain-containing protein [Anaerolineales bacterium]HMX19886.1 CBS domain-containing protein [Anaerolineales bacterium]HMX73002.1 CBS domain-containing protein [Anaerolineales bacterium]HMZ42738.1 CBS domain-containing protein [Anaerolineales bacterium]